MIAKRTSLWIAAVVLIGVAASVVFFGNPLVQWFAGWLCSGKLTRVVAISSHDSETLRIAVSIGVAFLMASPFLAISILPPHWASMRVLASTSVLAGVITLCLAHYYRSRIALAMALSDSLVGSDVVFRISTLPVLRVLLPGGIVVIGVAAVCWMAGNNRSKG